MVLPVTGKRSKTKQRILETAIELFSEHGFAATSIRDIVKTVGVANSTVYLHFKDKNEILYHIINEIGDTVMEEMSEATRQAEDPVKSLRRMISTQLRLVTRKRREIRIYMEEQFQLAQELRKKALEQHRVLYNLYYDKLTEIKGEGLLRDVDQTVMTFSIFAMMNWAYRWYDETGPLSIEEVAEDIIRIVFSGLLSDEDGPERAQRCAGRTRTVSAG